MSTAKGEMLYMRSVIRSWVAGAGTVALLLASVSCGDVARTGRSPSILVIQSIEAASGADPGTLSGFLLSDVQTLVEAQVDGETVMVPTVYNDIGEATLRIELKDQGAGAAAPSALNQVALSRYRIVYRRADGRNTAGVDVPYPIDGGVAAIVNDSPTTVGFEMVRHQAKEEAPLRALANGGGRGLISTIAEITFYGKDLAGNDVQVMGTISVSFGDYADPD
jgi:hypothetical protein